MQLIDIINLLIDKDKELFDKAFNIWCNIIYNKDAVYTEELVTAFMSDTGLQNIYSEVYIQKDLKGYFIKNSKWYLIYVPETPNEYFLTIYYREFLEEFIKEYGTN